MLHEGGQKARFEALSLRPWAYLGLVLFGLTSCQGPLGSSLEQSASQGANIAGSVENQIVHSKITDACQGVCTVYVLPAPLPSPTAYAGSSVVPTASPGKPLAMPSASPFLLIPASPAPIPLPVSTPVPTPVTTPLPTANPTSTPVPMATLAPIIVSTPVATPTPAPTASTPMPTATPVPTATPAPRYYLHVSNVDDLVRVSLNGTLTYTVYWGKRGVNEQAASIGHYPGDSYFIEITSQLQAGGNTLSYELENDAVCCAASMHLQLYRDQTLIDEDDFYLSDSTAGIKHQGSFSWTF